VDLLDLAVELIELRDLTLDAAVEKIDFGDVDGLAGRLQLQALEL